MGTSGISGNVRESTTAEQLALQLGWTLSVLFGDVRNPAPGGSSQLTTLHELPTGDRKDLELGRLTHLLDSLAKFPECTAAGLPGDTNMLKNQGAADYKTRIIDFNLLILKALALTSPGIELAYELGCSIRDTVNPPSSEGGPVTEELARRLARSRVTKMQDWLATLSSRFPTHAAPIVSASLGRWSELAELTIAPSSSSLRRVKGGGAKDAFSQQMREPLLQQGDLWLTLLAGTLPTSGLLSPEGYVAAGEEALRRSVLIIRMAIKKYFIVVSLVVILTVGILYVAYINLEGAAKVWTFIATIAGFLGLSAKSASSWLGSTSLKAGAPLFDLAQEDAMAHAITTIPEVPLKNSGVRQLRRTGVTPPAAISRP
jgi:hypothetical protein